MNFYLNDEGDNREGFQYVLNLQDLNSEELLISSDLLEEIGNVVGDENIDSPADNFYLICCKTEEKIDEVEQLCKKYENIFIEDIYND